MELELELVFKRINDSLRVFSLSADPWTASKLEAKNLIIIHRQSNGIGASASGNDVEFDVEFVDIKREEDDVTLALHEKLDFKVGDGGGIEMASEIDTTPRGHGREKGRGRGRGGQRENRRVIGGSGPSRRSNRKRSAAVIGMEKVECATELDFDVKTEALANSRNGTHEQPLPDLEMEFFDDFKDEVSRYGNGKFIHGWSLKFRCC